MAGVPGRAARPTATKTMPDTPQTSQPRKPLGAVASELAAVNDAEVNAFLGAAEFVRDKGHPELAEQLIDHFLERVPAPEASK